MRKPGARQDADARLESLGECCPSLGALAGPLVDGHYPLVSAAATDGYDESMIEKTKHVARDIAVATNQWRATAPPKSPAPERNVEPMRPPRLRKVISSISAAVRRNEHAGAIPVVTCAPSFPRRWIASACVAPAG